MHGIWKENPQAFIKLNMHRLKIDNFLNVPFEREVEKTTHRAAYQIYVEHQALIQPLVQTTVIVKAEEPAPEVEIESVIAEDPVPEVAIAAADVVPDLMDEAPVAEVEQIRLHRARAEQERPVAEQPLVTLDRAPAEESEVLVLALGRESRGDEAERQR